MSRRILRRLFSRTKAKPFSTWQIELTTRCPLRCRMCIREGRKDWYGGDMSIDNFKRLLPYLKDVETVILEGWGESLLHKNLIEAIRLVKEEGSEVGFVTSGKGLNKEYITGLINAGVDFIGFSLAGSSASTHESIRVNSDFSVMAENIKTFNEVKAGKKLKRPKLHIVYLMLKENIFEVPSLINLANGIGIEEVVLTNLIHVTNEWQERQRVFRCNVNTSHDSECHYRVSGNPEKQTPNQVRGWIPALAGMTGERSQYDNYDNEGYEEILKEAEIKAKELKIKLRRPSLSPEDVPLCEENPLRNLYISVDGEVSPCVYLYPPLPSPFKRIFCGDEFEIEKVSFGNIFRESFDVIWNKKEYIEFRSYFSVRKRRIDEIYSSLMDLDRIKKFEIMPLPDPPEHCKTCHKILGV